MSYKKRVRPSRPAAPFVPRPEGEQTSSWEKAGKWYNTLVGDKGHYFHQHVVIPNVLRLLTTDENSNILDIGCGQGVLARAIDKNVSYTGVDLANNLVTYAKNQDSNEKHTYVTADATRKSLPIANKAFTHATAILSLQNMERVNDAIRNVSTHLVPNGKFIIVLNHPAFRIPRQSGWGIDEKTKQQYRFINRYLSPIKIPITMNPGHQHSAVTWTYHNPLSVYANDLFQNGFLIETIEEWASDKESVGKAAKMENRAREEIPLFLTIVAIKK